MSVSVPDQQRDSLRKLAILLPLLVVFDVFLGLVFGGVLRLLLRRALCLLDLVLGRVLRASGFDRGLVGEGRRSRRGGGLGGRCFVRVVAMGSVVG